MENNYEDPKLIGNRNSCGCGGSGPTCSGGCSSNGCNTDLVHYVGGAVRESKKGKGTYKYIPTVALTRLSHRYQYGEMKYGVTDNFKKGLPASDCWDSAIRHLVAYMDGDNSEDHLAAVAWNIFTVMEMEKSHPEMMDIESRKKIVAKKTTPEYYRDLALEAFEKKERM